MNPKTRAALIAIEAAVMEGQQRIAPATFSHLYGRAATSAAFRLAKARGLIEVSYTSSAGTPVYRPAGTALAITEAPVASKH